MKFNMDNFKIDKVGSDRLFVTVDFCDYDVNVLLVGRRDGDVIKVINQFTGDKATGVYALLTNYANMVNAKDTPKKPIGDLNSVPHYRCPNCNNAVAVYEFDYKYPHCKWYGQAIDWSDKI